MNTVQKIFSQVVWQGLGKGATSISTLIVLAWLSRYYGSDGTGVYTLALTYLAFFFLFADFGLNGYLLPFLKKDSRQANVLLSARIVWSLALIVICNALALFLPFSNLLFQQTVLIGSLSILFSAVFTTTNLIFQQHLRYDRSILAAGIGAAVLVVVMGALVMARSPLVWLAVAPVVGWIVTVTLALLFVRDHHQFKFVRVDWSMFRHLLNAWPLSISLILNVVYFRLDSFILTAYRSFAEVGVYNFAYQFFQTALVLPTFVMNAFYPILLRSLETDLKLFKRQVIFGSVGLFALGLVGTLASLVLSPAILPLISGNSAFQGSVSALQILSLSFPVFFVSALLMWVMIALKKQKAMVVIYAVGLIVNAGLNFYFVPQYSYLGAAWVTVFSEGLILLLQILVLFPYIIS